MKPITVTVPGVKSPIAPSPGFQKKELADFHLELGALCAFGCSYCSSNVGNFYRINRSKFVAAVEEQTGQRIGAVDIFVEKKRPSGGTERVLTHARDPALHIRFGNAIEQLEAQLDGKPSSFGAGKTLVFSMLTDSFAPVTVASGATEQSLRLLLDRTSFRIRVLTKSAIVGNERWVRFFAERKERFVVGLSIGNTNPEWASAVEIGTSKPRARVMAHRALQNAGVPVFAMLCPIFPHMLDGTLLPDLLDSLRPQMCERIWAEPYNDRQNAAAVRVGYPENSRWHAWMTKTFGIGTLTRSREMWSHYASLLYLRLRDQLEVYGERGVVDRLRYLLYEGDVLPEHAHRFGGMCGVLLQGQKDDVGGRSKVPEFAVLETLPSCRFDANGMGI
jgi:DNA repair photolyase